MPYTLSIDLSALILGRGHRHTGVGSLVSWSPWPRCPRSKLWCRRRLFARVHNDRARPTFTTRNLHPQEIFDLLHSSATFHNNQWLAIRYSSSYGSIYPLRCIGGKLTRAILQKGDEVEYRPIGGAADNVSHSTGTITQVVEEGGVRHTKLLCLYPHSLTPLRTLLCITSSGADYLCSS